MAVAVAVGTGLGWCRTRGRLRRCQVELQVAQQAATVAARAKEDFLTHMRHEIRTPLSGVIGMTDLLRGSRLSAEQREFVETLRASGDALLGLVDDLLDLSNLESGRMQIARAAFSPIELMEEAVVSLAGRAQAKGLELVLDVDPATPRVAYGDAERIRQVVLHLVRNALKFTYTGEVVVRLTVEGRDADQARLRVAVRDTGIGISPEVARRLFQPFAQGTDSPTCRYHGVGLGLWISRQVIQRLGGNGITLISEAGQGATFSFELDLPVGEGGEPLLPVAGVAGRRVMLVDDHSTTRNVLEWQLRAWGVQPTTAADPAVALAVMRQSAAAGRTFDLVMVHQRITGGVDLLRALATDPALAGAKVILLGRAADPAAPAVETSPTIVGVLTLPQRQHDLRRLVATALGGRAGAREAAPEVTAAVSSGPREWRILVAEDSSTNQKVIEAQLRRLGLSGRIVSDGIGVLEAMDQEAFDLVLMDCQMPRLDGFEATRRLRERFGARPVVIAMTASAMPEARAACLAAGMDDHLAKPVRVDQLHEMIARHLTAVV